MYRRLFLSAGLYSSMAALGASLLGCSAVVAQPRFTVTTDQLQQVVGKRFPNPA